MLSQQVTGASASIGGENYLESANAFVVSGYEGRSGLRKWLTEDSYKAKRQADG